MLADPMGALITELSAAGIASGRVRGGEPKGSSSTYEGDALGPGHYKRFVVLVRLGGSRFHRAPLQEVRVGFRAYGVTPQDSDALYGEISQAVDNAGPRISANDVPIYQTLDDVGGAGQKDPDTKQPYTEGVIALWAGTEDFTGS